MPLIGIVLWQYSTAVMAFAVVSAASILLGELADLAPTRRLHGSAHPELSAKAGKKRTQCRKATKVAIVSAPLHPLIPSSPNAALPLRRTAGRGAAPPVPAKTRARRRKDTKVTRGDQVYRSQFNFGQELLDLGLGYIILLVLGVEEQQDAAMPCRVHRIDEALAAALAALHVGACQPYLPNRVRIAGDRNAREGSFRQHGGED